MNDRAFPPPPRPGTRRGRDHAKQRRDFKTGYFVERFFEYPFSPIAPQASQSVNMRVMSLGSRYIVVPAARGLLRLSSRTPAFGPLSGLESANLRLRLCLNGLDDWIHDGQGNNTASLKVLFGEQPSPWFWFVKPHRLRTGDNLIATITNSFPTGETSPTLTPELTLRFMDADIYWDLYGKLVDIREAEEQDLMQEEVG